MDVFNLAKYVDHTILSPNATWNEVQEILDTAIKFGAASACIPPCYVKRAKEYVGKSLPICTVIGFPLGYSTTATKVFEAKDAIENGADEIDMVINIGWLKDNKSDEVKEEIESIREASKGKILKVIIETDYLDDKEITDMCHIVASVGADFIKTSTGFAASGATVKDVMLMVGSAGADLGVKAAGGISSLEDAQQFVDLGVTRLGSSKVLKLLQQIENETK